LAESERIGVVLAVVVDAGEPRALDEIVGQDLVPEIDDLLRLGEEAVPPDVEKKVLIVNGPASAADVDGIGLDHRDCHTRLCQQVSSGKARRPCANDEDFRVLHLGLPLKQRAYSAGALPLVRSAT
jgi:hypothetical protein